MVDKDLRTEVYLCGDLNYRIEMSKEEYKKMIYEKKNIEEVMNYKGMLKMDQLGRQEDLARSFLKNYIEEKIDFPPTYKMTADSEVYSRERIPGWTDRIFNRIGRSKQKSYSCLYFTKGSDHRPVSYTHLTLPTICSV